MIKITKSYTFPLKHAQGFKRVRCEKKIMPKKMLKVIMSVMYLKCFLLNLTHSLPYKLHKREMYINTFEGKKEN